MMPKSLRHVRRHEVVALQGLFDLFVGLAGVVHIDFVQAAFQAFHFLAWIMMSVTWPW